MLACGQRVGINSHFSPMTFRLSTDEGDTNVYVTYICTYTCARNKLKKNLYSGKDNGCSRAYA